MLIDHDLLRDTNFFDAIYKLGYDRYTFQGRGLDVTCILWKRGDYVASVEYTSGTMELAAAGALEAARIRNEMIDGDEPIKAIQY